MQALYPKSFRWFVPIVALLDFFCFQTALIAGYWLWVQFPWHGNFQEFSDFMAVTWVLPPLGILTFMMVDLYKPEMGVIGVREQSLIFKGVWIVYFVGFAISFFYRDIHFSRLAVTYSIFIVLFLLSLERFLVRKTFQWLCQKGIAVQPAIIYGAGYHGQRLERWIRQSPQLGIQVRGFLDDQVEKLVKIPVHPPVLGTMEDLKRVVQENKIAVLFIAYRNLPEKKVQEIFYLCRRFKIRCWAIPSLYQFHVERVELQNIGGIPLLTFRDRFSGQSYMILKQLFDFLTAIFLLFLVSPLFILIALLLKITSPREPVFFMQMRVGKGGKKFNMYKFRTLKTSYLKEHISPELSKEGRKIDPLRGFLRVSGLDELPQLLNILKGEMSLVGPRPEMPFLVEKYGPLEKERLRIQPGITGLWQISDDRKRLLIHENMDYDLYYMEHMSFNMDLAILLKTVFAVVKRIFPRGPEGAPSQPPPGPPETAA